ncbi:phage protein [Seminibacterium arietis]|uniref:Phage protein n=1 Tax=Seminibacterium arietis TaxID=1173502 RepID=A0ABW3I781_9PAST
MKQFGRQWKVELSNDNETLIIEQLRVSFEINKTINEKPNPAKISIWNLNRTHINQALSQSFKKLTLFVGYHELRTIYLGDINKIKVRCDGLDFILDIECSDGFKAYAESMVSSTLKQGATDEQIIKEIQKTMPKINESAVDIPNKRQLPRGRVMNGDSRELLNRIAKNNNADWSIQDGNLVFLPKDKVINDDVILLSQETGMLGMPEQTDDGLELYCLLNPALQIGNLVKVQSILEYFNGEYKVIKLSHHGDGLGGDWVSRLTVIGGKFKKVEKEKKFS